MRRVSVQKPQPGADTPSGPSSVCPPPPPCPTLWLELLTGREGERKWGMKKKSDGNKEGKHAGEGVAGRRDGVKICVRAQTCAVCIHRRSVRDDTFPLRLLDLKTSSSPGTNTALYLFWPVGVHGLCSSQWATSLYHTVYTHLHSVNTLSTNAPFNHQWWPLWCLVFLETLKVWWEIHLEIKL